MGTGGLNEGRALVGREGEQASTVRLAHNMHSVSGSSLDSKTWGGPAQGGDGE